MGDEIELHQALHGYGDGHQLLSSSLEVTREQQWQMLVMSDLSGPSFRPGFENYLTGYPLVGGGFYCFARTWYAEELPRPGCVWTHTIIIPDTDLAHIHDFRSLLLKFRRPYGYGDFDRYGIPIAFGAENLREYKVDKTVIPALLGALYTSPPRPVVLTSDNSRLYEELAVAVLNQQWPRLRRSFSFCTGALAIRDTSFDLAVAPPDAVRYESDTQKTTILSPSASSSVTKLVAEDWIRVAVEDLMTFDRQTPLRRFLWKFGPDYNDGRAIFRALCEIYLAASSNADSAEQALSASAHFFPDSDSSTRLKAEFFGQGGYYSAMSGGELSVLRALVTHPAANSVPEQIADITTRAQRLCSSDTEGSTRLALMASNIGGRRAGRFLEGFAAGIASKSEVLSKLSLSLVFELLKKRPTLAASSQIWERSTEEQLAIASFLSSLPSNSGLGSSITTAVLKAGGWSSLATVVAHFRHEAVYAVLQWIDEIPERIVSLPSSVLFALSEHRQAVLEAVAAKPLGVHSLLVLTSFLDPRSEEVRALGTNPWLSLINSAIVLDTWDLETRSKAFLLSLGLSLRNANEVLLVHEGFSAVYEAARRNTLSEGVWDYVEPYLPWYLITWDRCARLIRGVVQAFLARDWPVSEFIATFKTEEQFRRALEEADRTYQGSRYVRSICDFVKTIDPPLDRDKKECLDRHCDVG
jgi:hypothetical protein